MDFRFARKKRKTLDYSPGTGLPTIAKWTVHTKKNPGKSVRVVLWNFSAFTGNCLHWGWKTDFFQNLFWGTCDKKSGALEAPMNLFFRIFFVIFLRVAEFCKNILWECKKRWQEKSGAPENYFSETHFSLCTVLKLFYKGKLHHFPFIPP